MVFERTVLKKMTKKELIAYVIELETAALNSRSQALASPSTHRCANCGSTACYHDEIASHPAYGT